MTHVQTRSISRILSRRNSHEKKVDEHIIDKMQKLFPGMFKDDMVDPARTAIMAAISNMGTYAFGAYDEPSVDGYQDLTTNGNYVNYLKWDWVNDAMEGVLKITLKNAKNLRDADILWNGDSDPYVVFSAGGSCVKSATILDNKNPVWNSTHYLFIRKKDLKPEVDKDLKITCFDSDSHGAAGAVFGFLNKDDLLGSASLPLNQLKKSETQSFELKLEHKRNKKNNTSTVSFATEFITVETAFKEMDKDNGSDTWLDRLSLKDLEKWKELTTLTEVGHLDVEKVAYIDAPSTGTQAWVHANNSAKAVVVAFRGTEMNRLKDIIADANFFPCALVSGKKTDRSILRHSPQYQGKRIKVHSGFKNAYDSVRDSILRIVYDLTDWKEDWTIIITGHSLGGALATMCAFEFENLTFTDSHDQWKSAALRAFHLNASSTDKAPNFVMMNFGAPKVGNEAFVKAYNETVSESLRVINANDLVHFLPPIMYRHTKFEVLLKRNGEVDINGIDFQSGHTREVKDQIERGEIKAEDLVKRAFSGFSVMQHLGTHYYELVKEAVKKFFDRLKEVREVEEAIETQKVRDRELKLTEEPQSEQKQEGEKSGLKEEEEQKIEQKEQKGDQNEE